MRVNSTNLNKQNQKFGAIRVEAPPGFNISAFDLLPGYRNPDFYARNLALLYKTAVRKIANNLSDFEYSVGYDKEMHKVVGIIKAGKKVKAKIHNDFCKSVTSADPNNVIPPDKLKILEKKHYPNIKKSMEESIVRILYNEGFDCIARTTIIPDAEAKRLESNLESSGLFRTKGKPLFDTLF